MMGRTKGHSKSRGLYAFLWKLKGKSSIGNRIFVRHRILSANKRVEFASDRMPLIVLRGLLCYIIFMNVHETSKEKCYDSKDSICDDLEQGSVIFLCTI